MAWEASRGSVSKGLSPEQLGVLASLGRTYLGERDALHGSEEAACSICMADYEEGDEGRVRFHLPCPFLPGSEFGELPMKEGTGPRALAEQVWNPVLEHLVEDA